MTGLLSSDQIIAISEIIGALNSWLDTAGLAAGTASRPG